MTMIGKFHLTFLKQKTNIATRFHFLSYKILSKVELDNKIGLAQAASGRQTLSHKMSTQNNSEGFSEAQLHH